MESEDIYKKMIEVTIEGKHYALIPLCQFHDIPNSRESYTYRYDVVRDQFGLRDMSHSMSLYEIVDPKKVILAKIKYGI